MRFFIFLSLFAITMAITNTANLYAGCFISGIGFSIAYFYGEGKN